MCRKTKVNIGRKSRALLFIWTSFSLHYYYYSEKLVKKMNLSTLIMDQGGSDAIYFFFLLVNNRHGDGLGRDLRSATRVGK
jgi:hypothetical protein